MLGLELVKGSRLIVLELKWGVEKGKGLHCVCQKEGVFDFYPCFSTVCYFVCVCVFFVGLL